MRFETTLCPLKRNITVRDFRSIEEEREYNIEYELSLTPDERFRISRELRRRVYGENVPDVRESGVVVVRVRDFRYNRNIILN